MPRIIWIANQIRLQDQAKYFFERLESRTCAHFDPYLVKDKVPVTHVAGSDYVIRIPTYANDNTIGFVEAKYEKADWEKTFAAAEGHVTPDQVSDTEHWIETYGTTEDTPGAKTYQRALQCY